MQKQIELLKQKIAYFKHHIHDYSDTELHQKPKPDKWSKVELIGHLIDSARINTDRFLQTIMETTVVEIKTYPQDDLVRINAYQTAQANHLIYLWQSLNTQLGRIWEQIPDAAPGFMVNGEKQSVPEWATDYVEHLEHHFTQIFQEQKTGGHALSQYHIPLQDAKKTWASQASEFIKLAEFGDLQIEYYQPNKVDKQSPHDRDELYIVISGSGHFIHAEDVYTIVPHDVLFVKAGVEHRFVDFSDDFAVWVMFYGMRR